MLLQRFEYFIYLLLIFLLPTQFGKHFWPYFSFIGGLRIDYLSPTVYVTDILIISLIFLSAYRLFFLKRAKGKGARVKIKNFKFQISNLKWQITRRHSGKRSASRIWKSKDAGQASMTVKAGLSFFILCLLLGVIFAKNQPIAIYGAVKLLEMIFFGWYTASVVGKKISIKSISIALSFGVLFESLLALLQFWTGGSLGGIWYFLGERTFSPVTPGIANASIGGMLVLRPYGTLPHPNVLAGFLLISLIFIRGQWALYAKKQRWFMACVFLLGSAALFATLSRSAIFLFVLLVVFAGIVFIKKRKTRLIVGAIGVLGVIGGLGTIGAIVLGRFLSTSFLEESFLVRVDLLKNAFWMVRQSPFFGVGLMNFLVRLPAYQHTQSYYQYLQPVHNIFALLLAELGIIGFLGFVAFLVLTVKHVYFSAKRPLRIVCLLMLGSVFSLGSFDHYFLTLQQGQLLLVFVIGLCYSDISENEFN